MTGNPGQPAQAWMDTAVDRYERPLIAYAARIVHDVDRARDVVHDTFVKLCDLPAGERNKLDGCLGPWLYAVCRNRALDVLRKEKRMTSLSDTQWIDSADTQPSPSDQAERRDATSHVLRMLATLPANQQEVVRLKFQHGLSYKEIADVTKLTVSNVGFLLHTALKTLRTKLAND